MKIGPTTRRGDLFAPRRRKRMYHRMQLPRRTTATSKWGRLQTSELERARQAAHPHRVRLTEKVRAVTSGRRFASQPASQPGGPAGRPAGGRAGGRVGFRDITVMMWNGDCTFEHIISCMARAECQSLLSVLFSLPLPPRLHSLSCFVVGRADDYCDYCGHRQSTSLIVALGHRRHHLHLKRIGGGGATRPMGWAIRFWNATCYKLATSRLHE